MFTHTIDYARVSVCHSVCRSAGNHHRYLLKASSVDDAVDWISRIKYVFHVVRNRATATARKQAHQLQQSENQNDTAPTHGHTDKGTNACALYSTTTHTRARTHTHAHTQAMQHPYFDPVIMKMDAAEVATAGASSSSPAEPANSTTK